MEKSDESIMLEVKIGNLTGMSILFERYNVRLYNFFRHMGLDKDTCQDLTQNLFYRMMKYRSTYKEGKSVKTWMYRIARNISNDYLDEQKMTRNLISNDDYKSEVSETESIYTDEEYQLLEKALMKLPTGQKELIILCRYQGLKYSEASEILDMSVPAIKVGMFRAIKNLQTIYFKNL